MALTREMRWLASSSLRKCWYRNTLCRTNAKAHASVISFGFDEIETANKRSTEWGWGAACLPGFPGDLAGVVRVHDGRRVHRASFAASPGSAAAAGENDDEYDEEKPRQSRRAGPRRPWRTRHCNR